MNVFCIVIRTHGSVLWGLRVFDLLYDKRFEEVTLRDRQYCVRGIARRFLSPF